MYIYIYTALCTTRALPNTPKGATTARRGAACGASLQLHVAAPTPQYKSHGCHASTAVQPYNNCINKRSMILFYSNATVTMQYCSQRLPASGLVMLSVCSAAASSADRPGMRSSGSKWRFSPIASFGEKSFTSTRSSVHFSCARKDVTC